MLSNIKRLASDILHVGRNKIRMNPDERSRTDEALTREDVRALIKDGIVYIKSEPGFKINNRRKRKLAGSRKGSMNSRTSEKETWMTNVRAQRKYLAQLVAEGALEQKNKRVVYMRIKGGFFKGKRALLMHLKDNHLYVEKAKGEAIGTAKDAEKK